MSEALLAAAVPGSVKAVLAGGGLKQPDGQMGDLRDRNVASVWFIFSAHLALNDLGHSSGVP